MSSPYSSNRSGYNQSGSWWAVGTKQYVITGTPYTGMSVHFTSWKEDCEAASLQEDNPFWGGMAEFGDLVGLTSLPFGGKSMLIAEMIAAIVTTGEFCGMPIAKCPIVLFDMENKPKTRTNRIKRALGDNEGDIEDLYHFIGSEAPRPLTHDFIQESIDIMKTKMGDIGERGVLIVDTMRSAFQQDDNDMKEMQDLLYPLQTIAKETGWCIIVLHHNAKYSNSYSGSTQIAGALDQLWNWIPDKIKKTGKLSWEGRGDICQEDLEFRFDTSLNRLIFVGTAAETNRIRKEMVNDNKLVEDLLQHCDTEWILRKDIEDISDKGGSTFRRLVADAIELRYIKDRDSGSTNSKEIKLLLRGKKLVDKHLAENLVKST
jgi:hypothetical protein